MLLAAAGLLLALPPEHAASLPRTPEDDFELDSDAIARRVLLLDAPDPARRLRGDFEPIDLLMLVHDDTWSGSLEAIVEGIAGRVPVEILVQDMDVDTDGYGRVAEAGCLGFSELAHDTPWIRDYGPLQVSDGSRSEWIDFAYADDRALDDDLPEAIAARYGSSVIFDAAQLDGGGVVSNGRGLCAMTETSLLESGVALESRQELQALAQRMGCAAIALLPALPDEQTGHADVAIQFVAEDRVAIASMSPQRHPLQAQLLDQSVAILSYAADRLGQPLDVIRVPMDARGDVFYSYLNGTRVGDIFLVPHYDRGDPDYQAAAYVALAAAMPNVKLVPIDADEMVELGGAIHCITLGLALDSAHRPRCQPIGTGPLGFANEITSPSGT
ncbi:MAG: agmatine deiminase family protein [Myxococcales bacterium]|nr:agmatine deiminase family protein [Myxococcales bacterium]